MSVQSGRSPKWIKYVLIAVAVAAVVIVGKQLGVFAWLSSSLQWLLLQVENWGVWAPLGFIAIYNIATVLLIPGSVLTLGSGVLFGVVKGSIIVFIAATLGATFAFLIGRYFARDWVADKVQGNPKFKAIDNAIAREGLKIVLLTRLSPVFPFNLLNYALGITQVSLKDYVIGSLGMIPGTILYVYIGSLAGSVAMIGMEQEIDPQAQMFKWALQIVGFLATVGVTVYVTKIAKAALNDSLEATERVTTGE
ncbi:TVP38/TMEM64 family protein [filamentous cyanobacterium LEGE 11480]|uniref:TVP38/TMEM64 family membrane protein n=1 Tax=Romeriopsis navalis LEGE 11480 TaxID=2777977 RepID=A0A928VRM1_9CYAN|nr:TVP38/TMEM64 family protein [Romeriopsis navalis]MBE9031691.1 TVP38/TMEM64 family protein [Romeriopsis navalis LEGE 11480]